MYKVEIKQRRRKNNGPRHFTQVNTKKVTRNNIREQLSNAHKQHVVKDDTTRKYNMVDSVNVTLALYYSRKIF
ncbi:MAG: hypothetical protein GPJ54_08380 [Candidatus Heimdallarchaeota archaeon]|nr:hypothetical protein [Candidatus Heimdallarchaeota archaeon]